MRRIGLTGAILVLPFLAGCGSHVGTGDSSPRLHARTRVRGLMAHIALLKNVPAGRSRRGTREVLLFPTRNGRYRVAFGPFSANQNHGADLSSNGRWFAYFGPANRGLYLVDLRRHRTVKLGHGLFDPYFSFDGRYLALARQPWPDPMPLKLVTYNTATGRRISVSYPFGGYTWARDRDVLMWPSIGIRKNFQPKWIVEERPSSPPSMTKTRLLGCSYSCGSFDWQWKGPSVLYWRVTQRPYEYYLTQLGPNGRSRLLLSRPVNCGKACTSEGPGTLTMSDGRIVTGYQTNANDISILFSVIRGHGVRAVRLAGHRQSPGGLWYENRRGTALLITWSAYANNHDNRSINGVALWRAGHKSAHEIGAYEDAFWVYPK